MKLYLFPPSARVLGIVALKREGKCACPIPAKTGPPKKNVSAGDRWFRYKKTPRVSGAPPILSTTTPVGLLSRAGRGKRRAGVADDIRLSQQSFAEMLGVRRSSVTTPASILHDAGAIGYRRAVIKVLDRKKLSENGALFEDSSRDRHGIRTH